MDCTYLLEYGIMGCVDENYDDNEDMKAHLELYHRNLASEEENEVDDKMNTILEKVLEKLKLSQNVELKAHKMVEDILDEEGSGSGLGDDEDY